MNEKRKNNRADEPFAAVSTYSVDGTYNFGYLDEQTKRMIRRCILKAIAVPGYQVPFGSREMPLPFGWGTGGIQLSAGILGPKDIFKVIAFPRS